MSFLNKSAHVHKLNHASEAAASPSLAHHQRLQSIDVEIPHLQVSAHVCRSMHSELKIALLVYWISLTGS